MATPPDQERPEPADYPRHDIVIDSDSANSQAAGADPGLRQDSLRRAVSKYAHPNLRIAVWELLETFVPYFALGTLMVITVQQGLPYWITLALSAPAAAFLLRVFVIFHDCSHGSFLASRRATTVLGYISGILTFTPFQQWRRSHGVHHLVAGDLDRRGVGDIWTLTVDEYLASPTLKRFAYRFYRHPIVMFGLGPPIVFFFAQRLPEKGAGWREIYSVIVTDLALLAIIAAASLTIEFRTYMLVQLPVALIAATSGVWLFYVQHQFEGVYWARHEAWDPMRAALEGSSYYRLPKLLQWITGSIGLHHIHHTNPRVPSYSLQQCYDNTPALQAVEPLTIRRSLKSLRMNLWDEKQGKLVSFRSLSSPI